ncbi:glycoside hydrolase family 16 protein [Flagelloscypha sp. PMI_526]|nr:glycoside hydrolase family 16 protein [Flagelloscypha sp. PMI_526]
MPARAPRSRHYAPSTPSQIYSPVPLSPRSHRTPNTNKSSLPFSPHRKPVPTLASYDGATSYAPTPKAFSELDSLPPSSPAFGITRGVATGSIGGDYGPYSYNPNDEMARNPNRFSAQSSSSGSGSSSGHSRAEGFALYDRPVPPPPPTESSEIEETPRLLPDLSLSEKSQPLPPSTDASSTPRYTTATLPQYIWDKDPEADDLLHNPRFRDSWFSQFTLCSSRGWPNVLALLGIIAGLLVLFLGGPIMDFVIKPQQAMKGYNLGGINASGQVPEFSSFPSLIDRDTPQNAMTRTGWDGKEYDLVFSDEFNVNGRSFYPGDDPFWEAADLHYWATDDLEYYDPSATTTHDGKLVITMTQENIKGLNYKSGMLTSWNKLCFTTGFVEVSVSLPGSSESVGFWPGLIFAHLGRPGYGASTEGMWPYSYDTCDVGTFPNQTARDGTPTAAATGGNGGNPLSFQPGQRLSACRGVPEIDILEAQIDTTVMHGQASQSFQIAPYNMNYQFVNHTPSSTIYDTTKTQFNTYLGSVYQQADEGYITWFYNGDKTWTMTPSSIGPDDEAKIGQRLVPEEPMFLILNFAMSHGFQAQDMKTLHFPAQMYVDYIRVYQRQGTRDGLTCNPPNYPTSDYINRHLNAYTNPNLTTWKAAGYDFPRNSEYDGC